VVKVWRGGAEVTSVNLQRCPYDGTPIEAEAYSGGSYLLSCTACGAEWEAHNTLVRRVTDPDWERARSVRDDSGAHIVPPATTGR
jgi:hypothetical protein